jgi:putative transposase
LTSSAFGLLAWPSSKPVGGVTAGIGIAISMDGRGRALDNVFIERLWRTVKYEEVYIKDYANGWEAERSLSSYLRFYCEERVHQSLGYRTPKSIYRGGG